MTGEEKLEKVFQYINRKADFGNTLSVGNARRAAQFAYDAGRESVAENMSELKWKNLSYEEEYYSSYSLGWSYRVMQRVNEFALFCNDFFLGHFFSVEAAKQAANEDYKQRIKQALEL